VQWNTRRCKRSIGRLDKCDVFTCMAGSSASLPPFAPGIKVQLVPCRFSYNSLPPFSPHLFTFLQRPPLLRVRPRRAPPYSSLPRLQVNRGPCRFGPYKNPRRPHPPPRASQANGLTLAHPCSPMLTHPRPPLSARPIDSACAGPFLAPGQRGRNGLPRRCRSFVALHTKASRL
jgi:hypothetical protein